MSVIRMGCLVMVITCLGCGFKAASDSPVSRSIPVESGSYRMAEYHQEFFENTIGMKFKLLKPGTFIMGSVEGDVDERPVHLVTISRPFYMGIYEVTQEQWKQIMGNNPSEFEGDNRPVESVSWNQVQEFIKRLSAKEGLRYRLPTEAEWEYACRAGTRTRYYWGDAFSGEYLWCRENSGGETRPVGLKKSNAWGLYDMSGNVYEWCSDTYSDYPSQQLVDPEATGGTRRIGRGGSWKSSIEGCRSGNRGSNHPFRRFDVLGFRLVRSK